MFTLKLIKGRSYSGIVNATQEEPFVKVESEDVVKAACATGYFDLVRCTAPEEKSANTAPAENNKKADDKEQDAPIKTMDVMSAKELDALGESFGVDVSKIRAKADKIEAIKKAQAEAHADAENTAPAEDDKKADDDEDVDPLDL